MAVTSDSPRPRRGERGLLRCTCSKCGEHFSRDRAYLRHRTVTDGCRDPATLMTKKGEPVFKAQKHGDLVVWVLNDPRTSYHLRDR